LEKRGIIFDSEETDILPRLCDLDQSLWGSWDETT